VRVCRVDLTTLGLQLLETPTYKAGDRYVIQNPEVVPVLFRLFPHMHPSSRHALLEAFLSIVQRSTLNQSLCCDQSLIFDLLGLIPGLQDDEEQAKQISSLVTILGSFSITVRELKRLVSLLKSVGDCRVRMSSASFPCHVLTPSFAANLVGVVGGGTSHHELLARMEGARYVLQL
jgi:hypothetical protein